MLLTIAVVNSVVLGLLFLRLRHLQASAAALKAEAAQLAAIAGVAAPDLRKVFGDARSDLISVEILNPMQLAAKESWFADVFGGLTPNLVRKIVYERAQDILLEELAKRGVEADVTIHRAA